MNNTRKYTFTTSSQFTKNLKTKKNKKNVHVAKLYAKDEIKQDQHLCGLCGEIGCIIGLELTSGKDRNANYDPKPDCKLLINKFLGIFY